MKRMSVLVIVASLVLAACSSSASTTQDAAGDTEAASGEEAPFELNEAPVETTEVTAVKSYKFDPAVIEVAAGAKVTWANEDDFPHNVHFLTGSDDTHDLPIGDTTSVTFEEAGEFYYECSIHPQQMRGKVLVTE